MGSATAIFLPCTECALQLPGQGSEVLVYGKTHGFIEYFAAEALDLGGILLQADEKNPAVPQIRAERIKRKIQVRVFMERAPWDWSPARTGDIPARIAKK